MKIIQGNREYLERKAAEIIKKEILKSKDTFILGVSGGRSVQGIFKKLSLPDNVHISFVDERCISLDDKQSNYFTAKRYLSRLNIHAFDFRNKTVEEYTEEFQQQTDRFDLILLGVGEDGHVASLFPTAIDGTTPSVENDSDYFIRITNSPKDPPNRMSASRRLLERSKCAIALFFGKGKQDAYNNFINPDIEIKNCPAKLIQRIKNSYVLTDL